MCFRFFLIGLAILNLTSLSAQQRPLDEEAYDLWNQIDNPQLSNSGEWASYEINPGKGDGILHLFHTSSGDLFSFPRSKMAQFDAEFPFCVFRTYPAETELDSLRRLKIKDDDLPLDTLIIFDLVRRSQTRINDLKSYEMPAKWGGFIIATIDESRDTSWSARLPRKVKKEESTQLLIQLSSLEIDTLWYSKSVHWAQEEPVMFHYRMSSDSIEQSVISRWALKNMTNDLIYDGPDLADKIVSDEPGSQVSFTLHKAKDTWPVAHQVMYWSVEDSLQVLAHDSSSFLPPGWQISEYADLSFSADGSKLYGGIAPQAVMKDTTRLPDEIPGVEVWTHTDGILYTQQKVREKEERERSYCFVADLASRQIKTLGSLIYPSVTLGNEANAAYAILSTDHSYQRERSWDHTTYVDASILHFSDDKLVPIGKKLEAGISFSPGAKYVYWYQSADTAWHLFNVKTTRARKVTDNNIGTFYDELNDRPMYPRSYGTAGWTRDDSEWLVYDRYDIWSIDPSGEASPKRLTHGRETKTVHRYIRLDPEDRFISGDTLLLHLFNEDTRNESYAYLDLSIGNLQVRLTGPYHLRRTPVKAKKANQILYTAESFTRFPDLLLTDLSFENSKQISQANPQQRDYLWGSIEPVQWQLPDGKPIKGLLVKPAHFEPTKQYPMIVNFYERDSDKLHSHRAPQPHRSTINYSYYASNGYLIFNPDVHYKIGYPGQSALDAIVSGTQHLISRGFVDPKRIALQGHSWGGYQIAHIITKTDMFRCAEAGAPVVNMISAYGGIRWQTGLSRMFQYERTQSRIGASLWERPDLYIENSPIFNLDKAKTPVLILHNDHDGHVPWYQGIEFFVAMRRLGKPAWLLNYNDEPHWPLKWQNRIDFNKRMFQFFEHYLKDQPRPVWMAEGVPAVEQGIKQGYEPYKSSN
ncbi:MAG: prolyl oligopeptidase family serine peptidase [Saprospiraceae bacterium]|nr:prolyl oligopeptidase family serine peptidase [Saprospiraceae bacterium]